MPESDSLPMPTFVSMTARRKRALGRELRDTVFRLCSVAGLVLGMLWDLHYHQSGKRPSSRACSEHGAHHIAISQAAQCIGNATSSALLSWLTPIGVGLLVGVIVGVLFASMIRLGRDSSHSRRTSL
jgi:predicted DNA repair protein MutK